MSFKNWVFTLNNYSLDEESELQVTRAEVDYIIYGHEIGESGTPHLQGYVEFSKRVSLSNAKKILNCPRLHLEQRKGTQQQAIEYCKKDDTDIYERGIKTSSGRPKATNDKNKLLPFLPLIKEQGLRGFANDANASFHLLKHAKEHMSITESPRPRNCKPFISWYWGATGTGKTKRAFDEAERNGIEPYIKSGNGKWFDGYDRHTFVIFDDFRDSHIEFGFLLRLLDRFPMRVEVKGASRQWKATRIIITSPMPPEECYRNMQMTDKYDKIQQLLRRLDEIVHITSLEEDPQTPQGGLKRKAELITPIKHYYPVCPASPLLPRPLPQIQEIFESPAPTQSPTQDWTHPNFE